MTQLIAQLRQITVGERILPSHIQIVVRVSIAFAVGVLVACMLI